MAPETKPSSSSQSSPWPQSLPYILLSAFAFLFGWSLSKLRTQNHEHGETETPQDNSGNERVTSPKHSSIVTQVMPSPTHSNQAETCRYRDTPRWKTIAEVIGIGAVVIYAIISYCQWRAQIQALRVDQRAWMNLSVGQAPLIDGNPIVMPIRLMNSGKTPAFKVQGVIVVNLLRENEEPDFVYKLGHPRYIIGTGTAIPNIASDLAFPVLPKYAPPDNPTVPVLATSSIRENIASGRMYIVVHGRITYDDFFRIPHWIKFCNYAHNVAGLPEKPTASTCGQYNDVDRNE